MTHIEVMYILIPKRTRLEDFLLGGSYKKLKNEKVTHLLSKIVKGRLIENVSGTLY